MATLWAFISKLPISAIVSFFNKLADIYKQAMEKKALEAAEEKGKQAKELEIRKNEKDVRDKLDVDPAVTGGMLTDDEAFGPNRKTRRN